MLRLLYRTYINTDVSLRLYSVITGISYCCILEEANEDRNLKQCFKKINALIYPVKSVSEPLKHVLYFLLSAALCQVIDFGVTFRSLMCPFRKTLNVRKTCPCYIQRILLALKIENFIGKVFKFLIFVLKTFLVGTR